MFCDAHTHLHHCKEVEREEIIAALNRIGVCRVFCNGTEPKDWPAVGAVAALYGAVVPCYGVHPWYCDQLPLEWHEQLCAVLQENPFAGIGEIGLDKTQKGSEWRAQCDIFTAQLRLARTLNRFVCVHCVKAWGPTGDILAAEARSPVLIHWFGGSVEVAKEYVRRGYYLSLSVSTPDEKLRDYVAVIPPEQLMLETDWPYHTTAGDYVENIEYHYARCADMLSMNVPALQKQVIKNVSIFTNRTIAG